MYENLPTLSVIMPSLNEADNIEAAISSALKAIEHFGIDGEIVVINDGSTDRTGEIVEKLMQKDERISLVAHDKPKGVGSAFWAGVKAAKHDFVTMIPGDNENDPMDVLAYYYLARDVDVIVPFIMNVEIRGKWRRILSSIYRFVINMSFGLSLNYTNGTVIYNRKILEDIELQTTGFLYQAELLVKLIRMGYFYAETPHLLSKRGSGVTKALTWRSFVNVTVSYLRLVWKIHITREEGKLLGPYLKINKDSASYRRYIARNNEKITSP